MMLHASSQLLHIKLASFVPVVKSGIKDVVVTSIQSDHCRILLVVRAFCCPLACSIFADFLDGISFGSVFARLDRASFGNECLLPCWTDLIYSILEMQNPDFLNVTVVVYELDDGLRRRFFFSLGKRMETLAIDSVFFFNEVH
jgi:hypothetical protein